MLILALIGAAMALYGSWSVNKYYARKRAKREKPRES